MKANRVRRQSIKESDEDIQSTRMEDLSTEQIEPSRRRFRSGEEDALDHLFMYQDGIADRGKRHQKRVDAYKEGQIDEKPPEVGPEVLSHSIDQLRQQAHAEGTRQVQLDPENLEELKKAIIDEEKFFDELVGNEYHNAGHTLDVAERVAELAEHQNMSEARKQTLVMAALYHDYAHSVLDNPELLDKTGPEGEKTVAEELQVDHEKLEKLRESHQAQNGLLEEEFAAIMAVERLSQENDRHPDLPAEQRMQIMTAILGTRFDIDHTQPAGGYELSKCLEAADLGDVKRDEFGDWVGQGLGVWREDESMGPVENVENWARAQQGFLQQHVAERFNVTLTDDGEIEGRDDTFVPEEWIEGLKHKYEKLDEMAENAPDVDFDSREEGFDYIEEHYT